MCRALTAFYGRCKHTVQMRSCIDAKKVQGHVMQGCKFSRQGSGRTCLPYRTPSPSTSVSAAPPSRGTGTDSAVTEQIFANVACRSSCLIAHELQLSSPWGKAAVSARKLQWS